MSIILSYTFASEMKMNKKPFSMPNSSPSHFPLKLLGVSYWRQLCLVLFLVTQNSQDSIQRARLVSRTCSWSRIGFVIPLECVHGTKDGSISDNCSGNVCSGVSTSDLSALHRMLRFTSVANVFQAHQSESAQSLQA